MCIPLTPMLYFLTTVIIEVYSLCFTESVRPRDISKSTSCAEISSPSSLYLKAGKGAHIGSALTCATSELTNSNRKKNSPKTHFSLLRKQFRLKLHSFLSLISIKLKKKGEHNLNKKINKNLQKEIKMDQYNDQSPSNLPTHSEKLQLAVLKQQNTRLTNENLPFKVRHYQH